MARRTFVSARNRPYRLTLVAALAVQVVVAAAHAASGDLDPAFGTGGKVTTDFGGTHDFANALALQADGKIIAGGCRDCAQGGPDFALARYDSAGTLDSAFGVGGRVTTDFGSIFDAVNALAVQADGKIIAAGTGEGGEDGDFALARYNTDGTLDSTFGTGGKVTTDMGHPVFRGSDQAYGLALQEDGKIVAAGIGAADPQGAFGTSWDFGLARYNTDGTLDVTFGRLGRVTTDFGHGADWAFALALQEDGKIVAAGSGFASNASRDDFALARYNLDGSLDASFGSGGKVTTDFGDVGDFNEARAVVLQEDGKIVAAGFTSSYSTGARDFALARYNTDGTLDTTFGTGGKLITDFGGSNIVRSVAQQEDGKILAAGSSLARYTISGALDSAFGTGGNVFTSFGIGGVALQQDGKIVAAGGSGGNFVVARYIVEADLSLTKTGPPGRVPTGRNMTYSLSVSNNGPDRAVDVSVADSLPASVSFVSVATSQGSCSELAGTVTCTLGPLANATTATIDIVVRPDSAGAITNTATVSALTTDPNEANNTDSVGTSICRITSRRSSIPCG